MTTSSPARRVAIIGPGRLGTLMAVSLRRSGYRIVAIGGGSETSRDRLAQTLSGVHTYDDPGDAVRAAELVILAVPDRALEPLVRALAVADVFSAVHQLVHVAGIFGPEVLAVAAKAGAQVAACHPAVSVPTVVTDPDRLMNAAWALTASPINRGFATALIHDLGGTAYLVEANRRVLYHAALTVASNATAAALVTARRLLAAAGVADAHQFLTALATSSVAHAVRDGVAGVSGPVVRGDVETLGRHADAILADVPDCYQAYQAFTAATVHTVVTANPSVDAPRLLAHLGHADLPGQPQLLTCADALRDALAPHRRHGRRIVLVPTMGALHAGHLALVRQAHRHGDVVVVSIFVNPLQFENPDDLAAYPQTLETDLQQLADLCDAAPHFVFVPDHVQMYPNGRPQTQVVVSTVSETLCGAHRAGHFVGVATVVTKLFALVGCDVAVFGQKDFQQAAVIRQLVADLNLPVTVVVAPTVRASDGLAWSSRNERLGVHERAVALGFSRALAVAATTSLGLREGVDVAACVGAARQVLDDSDVVVEYVAAVDPVTLQPVSGTVATALLAIAGYVGDVRLIDNVLLGDRVDEQRLIAAVFGSGKEADD